MIRNQSPRILVVDDVGLIARCVATRISRAAVEPALGDCIPASVESLEITGGEEGKIAAARIEAAIFEHDVNVLVADRGIADAIQENREQSSGDRGLTYHRAAFDQIVYVPIEDILAKLGNSARAKINILVVYTLDALERFDEEGNANLWYVDEPKLKATLARHFNSHTNIHIIRTNSQVYHETRLKLFNSDPRHPGREVAYGPDLQLYGAIAGEMAWRHIVVSIMRSGALSREKLRDWLRINFFIFALVTFGLGLQINAAYDLIKSWFSTGAVLVVAACVGILLPFFLLLSNPRLLMLPTPDEP